MKTNQSKLEDVFNQCFYLVKIKQDIMGHKLDWVCRSWEGWTVYEPKLWPRNQIRSIFVLRKCPANTW